MPRNTLTKADAAKGQKAAAAVRAKATAEKRRAAMVVHDLVDGLEREDISALMLAVVVKAGMDLATQELPKVETTLDAVRMMELAEKAHRILRLEAGESTSNVATAHVDPAVLQARLSALRGEADTPST